MPSYDFDGTVVFVTGAARGQGRSHAVTYAEGGADVVLADLADGPATAEYPLADRDDLDETAAMVEDAGGRALPVEVDVREESEVAAAVDRAVDEFGRVDVLANNAGVWGVTDLLALDERQWDEVVETNLRGAWLCAKHVGKHFVDRGDGGRIVSTASIAGLVGTRGSGHYAAAKHGVVGLTKTLALELAEHGVTVNCVAPTGVATPMIDGILETRGEAALARSSDLTGSMNVLDEQLLDPRDVSEAFAWLSSDAARYITGAVVPVDAGATAK